MFPSFLCTCCFINFKLNVTQSPPVAGFVVQLITIYKVKKEQALYSKVKKIEDRFPLLWSANIQKWKHIWSLLVLNLPRYPDFWESSKAHHHLL